MSWPAIGIIFSICLFLLAPHYRRFSDSYIWPWISDRWASWSQKRLQEKIVKLEYEIGHPLSADDLIIYGIRGTLHVLGFMVSFFGVWFIPSDFHLPKMLSLQSVNLPSWINETELIAWLRILQWLVAWLVWVTALWYYMRLSKKHLDWKYPNIYLVRRQERIARLKEALARKYPNAG